jgi:hypothetical protein
MEFKLKISLFNLAELPEIPRGTQGITFRFPHPPRNDELPFPKSPRNENGRGIGIPN